jgi:sarcosine oxidase subunit gamma
MAYDVTITRLPLRAVFDLKGARAALSAFAGTALPPLPEQPHRLVPGKGCRLALIGPDHWLLFADAAEEERLTTGLRPERTPPDCSIVAVSDMLAFLSVVGPDADDVMAVASPLDLHPRAFGADSLTHTEAFGIKALVCRTEGGFELGVERSYADWFQTMLERTAF